MTNLEELKQELIDQKKKIESKGGTVVVANNNPSPSEITAGIDTISAINTSQATATTDDVLAGKTFFAGDSNIKTGTFSVQDTLNHTFIYNEGAITSDKRFSYTIPNYVTSVRNYFMEENPNYLDVYFHTGITRFENYAFSNCINTTFHGFNDLSSLEYVGVNCFQNCNPNNFNLSTLPQSLVQIQQKAFANCVKAGVSINISDTATVVGVGAFAMDTRVDVPTIKFPVNTYAATSLGGTVFKNIGAHCDFVTPSKILSINNGFNIGGSFDNITLTNKVKTIQDYAFGAENDTDPIENFFLKTVTFENTTPPTSLGRKIFALQNLEHDFKIYVPDESLEAYLSLNYINTWYTGYVFPVSQKE